jgi:glycosyltransferase involved in cell wall biosynthesis
MLLGPYDSNPSALRAEELQPYIDEGIIEYFGEQGDVRPFIAMCSTFVLPSYREGTPKAVLEAMAMGRSIITSNAPGCKETVIDGENGYLVKVKEVKELAEKMEYLILNPEIYRTMGEKSLMIAREKYDVNLVNRKIMEIMKLA